MSSWTGKGRRTHEQIVDSQASSSFLEERHMAEDLA